MARVRRVCIADEAVVVATADVSCVQLCVAATAQNTVLVSMVPRCSDFFPVWGGMLMQLLGLRCKLEVFDGSEGLSLRNL